MFRQNDNNARIIIKSTHLPKDSKCVSGNINQNLNKEKDNLKKIFDEVSNKLKSDIIICDGEERPSTHLIILTNKNTKKMKSFNIKIKYYSSEDIMKCFLKLIEGEK
jgi:t-SNARE complex subunit (syntaxin)